MKRWFLRAYVTIAILAMLAVPVSVIWRVHSIREARYVEAADSFRVLSREAASLWQSVPLEDAAPALAHILRGPDRFVPAMVSISAMDDGFDYIWALSDQYIPAGYHTQPHNRFPDHMGSFSHARFVRSFALADGDRRVITALYPLFPARGLYVIFRDGLIGALAVLAVAVLMAVGHRILQPRIAFDSESRPTDASGPAASESAPPPSILVPESFMTERLDAELERAGFSEQDLAVAVIEFNEGSRGDAIDHQNSSAIRSFFSFRDLCFELGADSAVVLIPNTTLHEALGLMERFQRYYWEQRSSWNRESADFFCGVSSRAARLVDAERVLGECHAALRRARDFPGHIMGFQPDPGKYRDFMAACNKSSA